MARGSGLNVVISGDASLLDKALGRANKSLDQFGKQTRLHARVTSRGFSAMSVGATGAAAAIGGLGFAAVRFYKAAEESEKVARQTAAVIKSTGGAANVTAKDVDRLADSLARKSGIDDEAIASAQNLLLTFTNVRNETGKGNKIFDQATSVIADMSVALDQGLKSSSIQVGKALNDPIKGITALSRVGVSFTAQQKQQITALVESGRTLDAQRIILKELNREFAGSAAAQAQPFDKLKVAVGNVEEAIGAGLKPAIDGLATSAEQVVRKVLPNFERLGADIGAIFQRKDIDLGEKLSLSTESVRRNLGPVLVAIRGEIGRLQLGDKLAKAFEAAVPALLNAAAAAAPRAAGAFVTAFRSAGPWAQLLTAGFIISKLGGFNAAGSWAAAALARRFKAGMARSTLFASAGASAGQVVSATAAEGLASRLPASMDARKGRFNSIGKNAGKFIGRGMVLGIIAGLIAFGDDILKAVKNLPGIRHARELGENIYRQLRRGIGAITGLGDGAGIDVSGLLRGVSAVGRATTLKGADADLAPFANAAAGYGLGVSSGLRPGAVTKSGNPSFHGTGDAIDVSGPPGGMLRFFRAMKARHGSRLNELIYTPGGVGIKDGRPHRYTGAVAADHFDHVHIAYTGTVGAGQRRRRGQGDGDGLDRNQRRIAQQIIRVGRRMKATPRQMLAAIEAALVESNLRNLNYGDRDSVGVFQQRPSQGWKGLTNVPRAAAEFFRKAMGIRGFRGSAGQLAQAVQRSAYPARYDKQRGRAQNILKSMGAGTTRAPAVRVNPYEMSIARADLGIAEAESGRTITVGNRRVGPALQQIAAKNTKRSLIGARIRKVRRALKNPRLSGATRLRLTQELPGLLSEHRQLGAEVGELRNPSVEAAEIEPGPGPEDYIRAAYSRAGLTAGLEDDQYAASEDVRFRTGQYQSAVASGDPRKIADAADALKQASDNLKSVTDQIAENARADERLTLNTELALAGLTETVEDDKAATEKLLAAAERNLADAQARGDREGIIQYAGEVRGLRDDMRSFTAAVEENTRAQLELTEQLLEQSRRANAIGEVQQREVTRAMADIISSQLGMRINRRSTTAGSGRLTNV